MLRFTAHSLKMQKKLNQHIWLLYSAARTFGFVRFSYAPEQQRVHTTGRHWKLQWLYYKSVNWLLIVIALLGIVSDAYDTINLVLYTTDRISTYRAQSLLMTFSMTNIVALSIVSMCRICLKHEQSLITIVNSLLKLRQRIRFCALNDAHMRCDFLRYLYLRWTIVVLMVTAMRPSALTINTYVLAFSLYYGVLYELFYYAFILFNLLILTFYRNLNEWLSRQLRNCEFSEIDELIELHRCIEQLRFIVAGISLPYLLCIYIRVMISSFEVYVAAICLFFREYSDLKPRSNRFVQAISFVVLQFFDVAIISHLGNKLRRTQRIFLDLLAVSSLRLSWKHRQNFLHGRNCRQQVLERKIRALDTAILFSKMCMTKITAFNLFVFERSNILEFVNTVVSITVTAVQYSISELDVIDKRETCPA